MPLREVLWIVDDRADDSTSAEVIFDISANFHFEMVEASLDCFFGKLGDFGIVVACRD